jgi:GT2 family glycosyltransferase
MQGIVATDPPLPATIVIPTRDRPTYLQATLAAIVSQANACGCEVIVVDDSGNESARAITEHSGARYAAHPRPLGANAARNTGIELASGELIVFVDDDVIACEDWLAQLLAASAKRAEIEVFAGAILPLLEGSPPRSCGREPAPITTLDLGPQDTPTRFGWSANLTVRRSALLRAGRFDGSLHGQGEEQEWQERLQANGGGEALYIASARVMHRRAPQDARLRALIATAYRRGVESRRFDAWREEAPPIASEVATLLGCLGHVVRYRCPSGLTMVAHTAGRLEQGLRQRLGRNPDAHARKDGPTDDFLSGDSGTVGGLDGVRRRLADRATDAAEVMSGQRLRLKSAARTLPCRSVLALGVVRTERRRLAGAAIAELRSTSRHQIELHTVSPGGQGKFQNLRDLLQLHPAEGHDWLIVFDDDIELPRGFLDRFMFLVERFAFDLAQPAHRRASHAAWQVTRRQPKSIVRETRFVEIGPLTAFSSSTFETLLPFPSLRMGWGLEAHWAAIAKQRGWRCGVVDALAINHRAAPAGASYSRQETIAEARDFLAQRPYLPADETQRTLAVHSRW